MEGGGGWNEVGKRGREEGREGGREGETAIQNEVGKRGREDGREDGRETYNHTAQREIETAESLPGCRSQRARVLECVCEQCIAGCFSADDFCDSDAEDGRTGFPIIARSRTHTHTHAHFRRAGGRLPRRAHHRQPLPLFPLLLASPPSCGPWIGSDPRFGAISAPLRSAPVAPKGYPHAIRVQPDALLERVGLKGTMISPVCETTRSWTPSIADSDPA